MIIKLSNCDSADLPHLHGHAHGVAEVDHDEGDDCEPLLFGEGRHGETLLDTKFSPVFPIFRLVLRFTDPSWKLSQHQFNVNLK